MSVRFLAAGLALLMSTGCAQMSDFFGLDDVPRVTVETEIPLTVRLPPQSLPGLPEPASHGIQLVIPVNVIEHLEATGRSDDAKLLKENRDKLESVRLLSVQYEVRAPNQIPADVEPVDLYFGPPEMGEPAGGGRLGRTVAIPARTAIALRELEYDLGAPDSASEQLQSLEFAVGLDTALTLYALEPVEEGALALRLSLSVEVTVNLLK